MSPTTTISPTTALPVELWDTVIDFCHSDRESLLSCSLVRKSWIPCARLHLFELMGPVELFLEASDDPDISLLLESPRCTIGPYLTQLRVGFLIYDPDKRAERQERFWRILTSTSGLALESLQLDILFPLSTSKAFTAATSTLTSLKIHGCIGRVSDASCRVRQVLELISSMRRLENLELSIESVRDLSSPILPEVGDVATTTILSLPRLRTLSLREPSTFNAVLPWLSVPDMIQLPNLSRVELHMADAAIPNVHVIQLFLDTACSLTVQEMYFKLMWTSFPALDLSRFQALHSVEFHAISPPAPPATPDILIHIAETIYTRSKGTPVQIRYASAGLDFSPPRLSGVEWVKLSDDAGC
ncbi:hypothetical protein VNI00_004326 [Paramarasmius palmivorus]|uniref:F-box domain-containing protein n=1 Tax=Paramarasmius palmivorus TaxID=297713 RepID=A0AAW0DQ67_9AGAR